MSHTNQPQLTAEQKQTLKQEAEKHISGLIKRLQERIDSYQKRITEAKDLVPNLRDIDLSLLDPDSDMLANLIAKVSLFETQQNHMKAIQNSPYFLRLDLTWKDSGEAQTIYISKFAQKEENIFSWVSPISTLRHFG